ncbi:hypothetical protein niasHT_025194 [Heterodera trifolii]|uniref:Ubiquitin-like domain-containing protein n=1 Tax=Heterodera trifolii TaxID=157864 RepID=A0ABD2JLJ7_9BILA
MPSFADCMKIKVNCGINEFSVELNKTDTVATLKQKIEKIEKLGNIPAKKQILAIIGWKLFKLLADNEKTIDEYAIGEGQNVFVSWYEFEFFVEYKEKMNPINVKAMTTIKEVKEKMAEITGIPTEKQTLSHYKYGQCNENGSMIKNEIVQHTIIIMSVGSEIKVKWQNDDEFFLINVNGTDTVATLKRKIEATNEQGRKSG